MANNESTGGKPTDMPIVLITGAAGNIGSALARALKSDYYTVGMDIAPCDAVDAHYEFDITSSDSVQGSLNNFAGRYGRDIAAVVHLAAYFDFTGEDHPAYQAVNVDGTRNLMNSLADFKVERFIYSSTMLVHEPQDPGTRITEETPIAPPWIYPRSKAETEAVIREHAGAMPYTMLRLAGLYDDKTCVPTLSHQIARIYEQTLKSHLYAGDTGIGQSCIHQDDMIDAFCRTIERRDRLPARNEILVGEDKADSYESLQNRVGELIHGADKWATLTVPAPVAKAGAWLEEKTEPIVPDDFDKGEKPFIRPFMIDRANDHYELDITRAREQLGWKPSHRFIEDVEKIVDKLKSDPKDWYEANGITPPDWVEEAHQQDSDPQELLERHEEQSRNRHRRNLWAHFANMVLGAWLVTSPPILGYQSSGMAYSDTIAGLALVLFGFVSLSRRQAWARWVCAAIGFWLLFAPLVFWTESAAAYLNGTLIGMLAIGFAAAVRPVPGVSPVAAMTGPTTPPGWDNNPSSWFQRLPVIMLALVGFFISRYLAAYQLGHIDALWDPFFQGTRDLGLNGTEDIVTSSISEAWPVPDAGVGGIVYALEILIGMIGATHRWRSMPWVVASFGVLIVPLGVVSISFIIIQPVLIGTWCTLCLMTAAVMLLQIAYAFNEFVATGQFLKRRHKAGAPVLKIFFVGDTDEGATERPVDDFDQAPGTLISKAFSTGVNLPWNLAACMLIGAWLMLTRVTLGNEGAVADWDHLVGSLVITLAVLSMAGSARPLRLLMIPMAVVLFFTPLIHTVSTLSVVSSILCGAAIIALSLRRGPVPGTYGAWNRLLV